MADETLTGEVKFEYQQVTAGFDKIADGLGDLSDKFKKFGEDQEKAFGVEIEKRVEQLGAKLSDLGKQGFAGLSAFIAPAVEFQAEMANVDAVAKLTDQGLADFSERVRTLGREIGVSVDPVKAAAGAYDIIGAGFTSAAESEKVLTAAIKDSRAGRAELTEATDVLTTELNAYSLSADHAGEVSDKLLKTVDLGKTTFPQLAQSLGLVASSAAQSGVSLDELSAVMALATANGIRTSSAAEGLRSLIGNLVKPSAEAKAALKGMGLEVDGVTLKSKGLVRTLQEIAVAAKGDSGTLATIFADASGRTLAQSLIGSDNGAKLANFVQQMQNAVGATDAALQRQSKSADAARKDFEAAFKAFEIGASQTALPALTGLFRLGLDALSVLDKIPEPVKAGALALTAFGSAAFVAVGGLIALKAGLPFVVSQMSLLGGQVGLGAARAIALAGTQVTVLGAQAALSGAATRTADLAYAGFANTVNGLATAFGVTGDALAATVIGWGAVGGATILAAKTYSDISKEVDNANDALVTAGASLVQYNKQVKFSAGDLLNTAVPALVSGGAKLEDFVVRIEQLRDKLKELKDAKEASLGPDNPSAGVVGTGGAGPTGAGIGINGVPQVQDDQISKTQAQIDALRQKEAEFAKLSDAEKARIRIKQQQDAAAEAAQRASDKAYLDGRKERLANELLEIEQSKKSSQVKIQLFTNLLNTEAETGEEQRNIKRKIFAEQEKIDRATEQATAKKKKDAIDQAEFEIEHSKRTTSQKIEDLQKVIKTYGLEGDAKRAVLAKIDQLEKKAADDEANRIKQLSDLRAQANEKRAQQSQDFLEELQRQEDRGIDTSAQQVDVLAAKAEAERQKIKEALKADLAKVKDPATQKQIKQNSQADLDKVDRDQAKATRDVQQKGLEDRLTLQKEAASAEVQLSGIKIGLLKDELLAGKDVQSQFEQAVLKRLELTEQQIKLEAQLEASRTDNAQKQQRIELEAQAKILEAHRSTRKEIDEATKALQRQKQAESGGDTIQTLDQVLKEQSDTFGRDAVRKRTDEIRAKNSSGTGRVPFNLSDAALKAEVNDLANRAERSRLNPELFQNASLAGRIPGADSAGGPRPTSNVQLQATIRLLGEDGKEKPFKIESQQVTVDGQNSRPSILANRFSKSFAGV